MKTLPTHAQHALVIGKFGRIHHRGAWQQIYDHEAKRYH